MFVFVQLYGSPEKQQSMHDPRLNSALERFSEAKLMLQFLQTGRLSSLSQMAPCGDEEYLGAVLGFAQEMSRYALGRAAEVNQLFYANFRRYH